MESCSVGHSVKSPGWRKNVRSDNITCPDTGEMTRIIRNWTYGFTYEEDQSGLLYGRIQCSSYGSFGHYTSPHVYFNDMLVQTYWTAWDSIYILVNSLESRT